MNKLDYLILEDGSEVKIPDYVAPAGTDADAEENLFVVNVDDPLSIASILKYQIENWEQVHEKLHERGDSGEESISYGTINDDNEFESLEGYIKGYGREDFYYSEQAFVKAALKFPQLLPLLEEYCKLLVEASREEKTGGPWATEETILGQFMIPELAAYDKKYYYLMAEFAINVEIRCSPGFREDYLSDLERIQRKWGIVSENKSFAENTVTHFDLSEEIDYDKFFAALAQDSGLDDAQRELVRTFMAERDNFGYDKLLDMDGDIEYYETKDNYGVVSLADIEYICFKLNVDEKRFSIKTIESKEVELSLSDDFYEIAAEVFEELL